MAVAFLAEVFILPATIKLLPGCSAPRRCGASEPAPETASLSPMPVAPRRDTGHDGSRRACCAAKVVRGPSLWSLCLAAAVTGCSPFAQTPPTGYVSVFVDCSAESADADGTARAPFAEEKIDAAPHIRLTASGFVEGLLAHRGGAWSADAHRASRRICGRHRRTTKRGSMLSARVSGAACVWGRLDELQPTDVINPLDVSRFFFEGRSEARLPVPSCEAAYYRRRQVSRSKASTCRSSVAGRFDQLDERSSPFNSSRTGRARACIGCPTLRAIEDEPGPFSNGAGRAPASMRPRGRDGLVCPPIAASSPFGI